VAEDYISSASRTKKKRFVVLTPGHEVAVVPGSVAYQVREPELPGCAWMILQAVMDLLRLKW
jgi:hypothetical protein